MALGALYIQQRLGVTDRETVELITESPHLQFLIGLSGFQYLKPFDSSMLVLFRTSAMDLARPRFAMT
jgi:hypothetical protein